MKDFELHGEGRTDIGKGGSRRLRRAGKVPAILYGVGKDPVALQLNHTEMLQHLAHEAFYSHILSLSLNGATEKVVLKDLQRHPYRPQVLHMDFLRIDEREKLTMRVPVHFINEERCVGVKQSGGVISHLMSEIEVVCLPKDLPEYIEVDLANVSVGTTIHLSELVLPQGVEAAGMIHGDAAQAVVSVHLPRVATAEGEEGAAEAVAAPDAQGGGAG